MTDAEIVALREELARAMMRVAFDPSDKDVVRSYARDWNARLDDANAILPIIARERAAALAAATPLIGARATAAIVAWLRDDAADGKTQFQLARAIRRGDHLKGTSNE